jgi:hypothetical protein
MASTGSKTKKTLTRKPAGVLYLYGISRPVRKALSIGTGVDGGSPVTAVLCSGFACWVSTVDAREFGEELPQRMEDLEWLANAGVRHQRVVGKLAQEAEVLPARFGTVFRNESSLAADVKDRQRQLKEQLAHIKDAEEWGIKVYRRSLEAAPVSAASGSDYLRQKATKWKRDSAGRLDAAIVEFVRELQKIARDSAPAGKVSSGQAGLEWQASFLVPRAKRKAWDRLLQRYATEWHGQREIEATGPWPPYSFVGQ